MATLLAGNRTPQGHAHLLRCVQVHKLRLETHGTRIRALINGTQVAEVTSDSPSQGMAYLTSCYHRGLFDDVRVMADATADQ